MHLETALRGVVIGERWPKSACEVVITVLEGEEDGWCDPQRDGTTSGAWSMMSVLAGCITVASAALVDAGIDCVDLVSGGVAALVVDSSSNAKATTIVLDPSPAEHGILSACVVGYLPSRDEITEMWVRGDAGSETDAMLEQAVKAATMTRTVLTEAVKEAIELRVNKTGEAANGAPKEAKGKERERTPQ